MDRGRLKTFLIVLLLAVNLAFLSLLLADRVQGARLRSEARTELTQVLAGLDVTIQESAIPDTADQPIYRLPRDTDAEAELVGTVLGASERLDEGGGIYSYAGDTGTAQFRLGGFSIYLDRTEGALARPEMDDTGKLMLNKMELTARLLQEEGDIRSGTALYALTVDEYRVVNGQIAFTFSDGYLQEIGGTALLGSRQRYAAGDQLDAATALVRLAGYLRDRTAGAEFLTVEMGYYLTEGSGYLELRPVWIVETDGGTYSVDRQTGEIR